MEPRGHNAPYDPRFWDPYYFDRYGGFPAGRNFRPPPQHEPPRGGPWGVPHGGPPGPPPPPPGADPYGAYGGYPPRGGPGMPPPALSGYGDSSTTEQYTIPNSAAGAIMGPGGQRLRDIRSRSGAAIDVGDPIANNQRIVTIRGSRQQVDIAKEMLREVASHGY